jgi:ribonuclease R
VGDETGETYRLGDRVTVKLAEAAPVAGALRFDLLSQGRIERKRPAASAKTDRERPAAKRGKSRRWR